MRGINADHDVQVALRSGSGGAEIDDVVVFAGLVEDALHHVDGGVVVNGLVQVGFGVESMVGQAHAVGVDEVGFLTEGVADEVQACEVGVGIVIDLNFDNTVVADRCAREGKGDYFTSCKKLMKYFLNLHINKINTVEHDVADTHRSVIL